MKRKIKKRLAESFISKIMTKTRLKRKTKDYQQIFFQDMNDV